MKLHIFRNQNLRLGLLIIVMCLFLGAANPGKVQNKNFGFNRSEYSDQCLNQPQDAAPISILAGTGISAKTFSSVVVDNENIKWFLTEKGIISFNGQKWTLHDKNSKVPKQDLKDLALEVNPAGQQLWIATANGAIAASFPVDESSTATTYSTENAPLIGNNVFRVAIGKSSLRWFGTDKGISAFMENKWLKGDYEELYPPTMFQDYPITAMAASADGDSLYIGTDGAGVSRVQRNNVDGITGASSYAQWGPIILPSDKICSIYIGPNNTQWYGTDKGLARHIGSNTLANWTAFTTREGLVDNYIQSVTGDKNGQVWIGTKGGVSLFDGSKWSSFTKENGLNSNNILCIAIDKTGVVWFGTDDGVASYKEGIFTSYR